MSKEFRPLGWTTLEESKRLLDAGLSPDTADMYSWCGRDIRIGGYKVQDKEFDIPCWSLGNLISLLPEVIYIHNGGNYFLAMNNKSIQYYSKENYKHEIYFESVITQVLIESVVNLIIYLLEQGYIKKGENNE